MHLRGSDGGSRAIIDGSCSNDQLSCCLQLVIIPTQSQRGLPALPCLQHLCCPTLFRYSAWRYRLNMHMCRRQLYNPVSRLDTGWLGKSLQHNKQPQQYVHPNAMFTVQHGVQPLQHNNPAMQTACFALAQVTQGYESALCVPGQEMHESLPQSSQSHR